MKRPTFIFGAFYLKKISMSKLRSVSTGFWSDPFIEDLSPQEKLLYLYLITNDKTNMLGVYEISISKISFETKLSKDVITKALEGFERLSKVMYVDNYVILKNFAKNQNFNTNMMKGAIDIYKSLPKSLTINGLDIDSLDTSEAFETLSNHFKAFESLRKVEYEIEVETKVEIEGEGELKNAPAIFSLVSNDNFYRVLASNKKLKLTFEEFDKLINEGFSKEEIDNELDNLDNYKKNTNYTSCYLTIKKWLTKNLEDQKNRPVKKTMLEAQMQTIEAAQILIEKYNNIENDPNALRR